MVNDASLQVNEEWCHPLGGPHLLFTCAVSLITFTLHSTLLAQSSPTVTTTSSNPAPVLYQQKFRSPIKVCLKCGLFHEDFSEPTNHRKSLLPPNSGVILPIFLSRSLSHSESQLGYACMCPFITPTGQGSPQIIDLLFSLSTLSTSAASHSHGAWHVMVNFETEGELE